MVDYESRLGGLEAGGGWGDWSAVVAVGAAMVFVGLGILALRQRVAPWWPSAPIPVAAGSGYLYLRREAARARRRRLRRYYERAVDRVRGAWAGQGFTGEEFETAGHRYARDLGIFGEGSLFERLCIARTAIGRRSLAEYLLEAPAPEETRARQEAVRELEPQSELREAVALLGEFEFSEARWETFEAWLKRPAERFSKWVRGGLAVSSACLLAAGLFRILTGAWGVMGWLLCLLPVQAVAGLFYREQVNRMVGELRAVGVEIRTLREGLRLLEGREFRSAKLRRIQECVQGGAERLRTVELLLAALRERGKEWFYYPSLPLAAGTQLCAAIEDWRVRHGGALREWMAAWGEFEALNALGAWAHEEQDGIYAELAEGEARFEARGLGHPLLPKEGCVGNDVALNAGARFYIVSGSNMAGKSTLLRAIGLNAVLGLAGAPVRAAALRLSGLSVCASLAVVDSLENGRSKFLAEVDRLRCAVTEAGKARPVLFLIDEILGGTNSRDRRAAAEAVVRTLVERGAVGALSTHDLALAEIAELGGANVHMGAREGGGPMDFDYRVKPGVTRESNALAIARMAGVPV